MPTIKRTPLKTNTLTVTANKVDKATTSNAIALSAGKKNLKRRKIKQQKKKKIKMHWTARRDLNCNVKLPKLINSIPKLLMATAISERFLATIGARLRTKSQETTMGIFCADVLIMV
jgi:hypothetical protein